MKLLKKILPIASVASVAAVAAPIVASCGLGGVTLDGTKIYIPKSAKAVPASTTPYDENGALQLYVNDMKANPDVFKEDIYCYFSAALYFARLEMPLIYQTEFNSYIKLNMRNISAEIKNTGTDRYAVLSYTISGSADISALVKVKSMNTVAKKMAIASIKKFDIKVQNIAYQMQYNTDSEIESYLSDWIFEPNVGLSLQENPIIEAKLNGTVPYDVQSGYFIEFDGSKIVLDKKAYENPTPEMECILTMLEMLGSVRSSYHMTNIEYDAE